MSQIGVWPTCAPTGTIYLVGRISIRWNGLWAEQDMCPVLQSGKDRLSFKRATFRTEERGHCVVMRKATGSFVDVMPPSHAYDTRLSCRLAPTAT
jgi:hypothetical protein